MSTAVAGVSRGYLQHVPRLMQRWDRINVNAIERGVSVALGALTIVSALRRPGVARRIVKLASGAALVARGLRGKCSLYRTLGVTSA